MLSVSWLVVKLHSVIFKRYIRYCYRELLKCVLFSYVTNIIYINVSEVLEKRDNFTTPVVTYLPPYTAKYQSVWAIFGLVEEVRIMSADKSPPESGAHGLLCGQRAKSYGSLVTSCVSPVRQNRIQHQVQPGETLQGLSLKYGVSVSWSSKSYFNSAWLLNQLLLTRLFQLFFADGANQKGKPTVHQRLNIPEEVPLHPCPHWLAVIY